MDGWMGGLMDEWMDGWMDEWMDGWMDGCVDGWMDGWMDVWMDGWMDYPVVLLLCKVYIFLRIHVLPLFFKLLAFTQFLSYLYVSYMKSFPIGSHFQNRN